MTAMTYCEEKRGPTAAQCGVRATRVVSWPDRGEGPYNMCDGCAYHSAKNRGAHVEPSFDLEPVNPGPAPEAPGHNLPPHLVTYEAIKANVESVYEEAQHWLNGDEIENAAQAAAVDQLLDMIKDAEDAAEAARKAEKDPLDVQIADIQGRFNPLIGTLKNAPGLTTRAKAACLAALTKWREHLGKIKRDEAERLRKEAEAKAEEAAAAVRAAQASSDLGAREAAEALVQEAAQTAQQATRMEKGPTGLRTTWRPVLVDPGAALKHYAGTRGEEIKALLMDLAAKDCREGRRSVPGFEYVEEKRAF